MVVACYVGVLLIVLFSRFFVDVMYMSGCAFSLVFCLIAWWLVGVAVLLFMVTVFCVVCCDCVLYVSGVYPRWVWYLHAHFDLVVCFGYIACLGFGLWCVGWVGFVVVSFAAICGGFNFVVWLLL